MKEIYKITNEEPLSKDYKLRDQLRSAAVSVMSNIAEGFSRYHKKDFIRFLDIAQSSAAEVRSLMYVVSDQNYVSADQIKAIQKLADDCRYFTLGLLKYCNQNLNDRSNEVNEPETVYMESADISSLDLPDNFINLNT